MFMRQPLAATSRVMITATLLMTSIVAYGQITVSNQQAVDQRADDLVKKMTLDEKIELIGGDTPFRTHPISRLNIPYFQMADGPVGAHIPASGWRHRGTTRWRYKLANSWDATRAHGARRFCLVRA
jgi:beta-glucosidase